MIHGLCKEASAYHQLEYVSKRQKGTRVFPIPININNTCMHHQFAIYVTHNILMHNIMDMCVS